MGKNKIILTASEILRRLWAIKADEYKNYKRESIIIEVRLVLSSKTPGKMLNLEKAISKSPLYQSN